MQRLKRQRDLAATAHFGILLSQETDSCSTLPQRYRGATRRETRADHRSAADRGAKAVRAVTKAMASKRPIGPAGPPKEQQTNAATAAGGAQGVPAPAQRSAAFDAVLRMQLGQDCRTINDKINDSNRPTWDQYKKDNEDRLNLTGADQKKMMAYRAELDAERARKLARASKTHASLRDGSDDDDASADSDDRKKRKRKREKKKLKKEAKKKARKLLKKEKKKRKQRSSSSSSGS